MLKKSLAVRKILEYLKANNKTQAQFARELNISRMRLNQYLKDTTWNRIPKVALAAVIEEKTNGYIKCKDWGIFEDECRTGLSDSVEDATRKEDQTAGENTQTAGENIRMDDTVAKEKNIFVGEDDLRSVFD